MPIIKAEKISKRYALGKTSAQYATLRENLAQFANAPLKRFSRSNSVSAEDFWALQNINFAIEQGEVVGIIGRNGAGKSTLLKILARVTEPTNGSVELYGSVSSLLEVGTGFHPELTGRENIFVNGAILGMRRTEIKKRFDEIVEFADVEKFLDTPVKHYSSGMYMRLAFSVAAHLQPDILIIDEVLSVGDQQFQKKCLGKIRDVSKAGRTVLFVSHNLAAVENLCSRGIVLQNGGLIFDGSQTAAISHYLVNTGENFTADLENHPDRKGSGEVRVTAVEFKTTGGKPLDNLCCGQDVDVYFHFQTSANFTPGEVVMGFMVRTFLDAPVFLQHNKLTGDDFKTLPQTGAFVCRIRKLPLPPSTYRLGLSVMRGGDCFDRIDDAAELNVAAGDFYGSGEVPPISHGCALVDAEWRVVDDDSNE